MGQQAAFGTLLQIDNSGVYTTIAFVQDISGPGISMDVIETTSHEQADAWRTFVPGLINGGEVSAKIAYDPGNATQGNATGVLSELTGRTTEGFKIIWPDEKTYTFDALVTGFEPSAPYDGLLGADISLKVTGAITFA